MNLLPLILLGFSAMAWGQVIHRCADPQGNLLLQDRRCVEPEAGRGAVQAMTPPGYAPVAPEQQRLAERQRKDVLAATADNLRVLQLLQKSGESETHQYQENRQRCENARHIALLCGRSPEGFSCDEKGFRQQRRHAGAIDSSQRARYSAQQCVLRATMGSP